MEIEEIVMALRKRIVDFRESQLYKNSKPIRFFGNAISIAVDLTDLAINNNRPILPEERYWFEGSYLIDNSLTGEWEDISSLYKKLIKIVKQNDFYNR